MFLPDSRPLAERCELANATNAPTEQLSQFRRVLGRQILQYMDNSAVIGFYHANSIKGREKSAVIKTLLRNDMRMGIYSRTLIQAILKGTKYEAVLPLFESHTMMVFSNNPQVDVLLKLQKKMPQYILLAGIVENRFMSKEEMLWYGSLQNLDVMRGQLCATLTACCGHLVHHLQHHTMQLTHSLSLLAKSEVKALPVE